MSAGTFFGIYPDNLTLSNKKGKNQTKFCLILPNSGRAESLLQLSNLFMKDLLKINEFNFKYRMV